VHVKIKIKIKIKTEAVVDTFHPPQGQNVHPDANAIAMLEFFHQLYCLDALCQPRKNPAKDPLESR
jgi:hypothetical protein